MPRIAISYRRADSEDITGRIFDRLVQRFGRQSIFRDIDSIRPGIDFRKQIDDTLQQSDVLLAVVGPKWVGRGKGVEARIDNEADLVRIEIATALKRKIPLVPVLVGGTKMPTTTQLPDDIKEFAFRHAVRVDSGRDFDHHVDGLIRALDELVSGTKSALEEALPRGTQQPTQVGRHYALWSGVSGLILAITAILLVVGPRFFRDQVPLDTPRSMATAPVVARQPICIVPQNTVYNNQRINVPMTVGLDGSCGYTWTAGATVALASAPNHGIVDVQGGTFTYRPAAGFTGTDSFTLLGQWPVGQSANITYNVTVVDPASPAR